MAQGKRPQNSQKAPATPAPGSSPITPPAGTARRPQNSGKPWPTPKSQFKPRVPSVRTPGLGAPPVKKGKPGQVKGKTGFAPPPPSIFNPIPLEENPVINAAAQGAQTLQERGMPLPWNANSVLPRVPLPFGLDKVVTPENVRDYGRQLHDWAAQNRQRIEAPNVTYAPPPPEVASATPREGQTAVESGYKVLGITTGDDGNDYWQVQKPDGTTENRLYRTNRKPSAPEMAGRAVWEVGGGMVMAALTEPAKALERYQLGPMSRNVTLGSSTSFMDLPGQAPANIVLPDGSTAQPLPGETLQGMAERLGVAGGLEATDRIAFSGPLNRLRGAARVEAGEDLYQVLYGKPDVMIDLMQNGWTADADDQVAALASTPATKTWYQQQVADGRSHEDIVKEIGVRGLPGEENIWAEIVGQSLADPLNIATDLVIGPAIKGMQEAQRVARARRLMVAPEAVETTLEFWQKARRPTATGPLKGVVEYLPWTRTPTAVMREFERVASDASGVILNEAKALKLDPQRVFMEMVNSVTPQPVRLPGMTDLDWQARLAEFAAQRAGAENYLAQIATAQSRAGRSAALMLREMLDVDRTGKVGFRAVQNALSKPDKYEAAEALFRLWEDAEARVKAMILPERQGASTLKEWVEAGNRAKDYPLWDRGLAGAREKEGLVKQAGMLAAKPGALPGVAEDALEMSLSPVEWGAAKLATAANALNAANWQIFARFNPGYSVRNFLNNIVTAGVDDALTGMSSAKVDEALSILGHPSAARRAMGGFGTAEEAVDLAKSWSKGKGLGKLGNVARDFWKAGFSGNLRVGKLPLGAAAVEQAMGRRIVAKAGMEWLERQMVIGKAIPELPPGVVSALGQQTVQDMARIMVSHYGDPAEAVKWLTGKRGGLEVWRLLDAEDLDLIAGFNRDLRDDVVKLVGEAGSVDAFKDGMGAIRRKHAAFVEAVDNAAPLGTLTVDDELFGGAVKNYSEAAEALEDIGHRAPDLKETLYTQSDQLRINRERVGRAAAKAKNDIEQLAHVDEQTFARLREELKAAAGDEAAVQRLTDEVADAGQRLSRYREEQQRVMQDLGGLHEEATTKADAALVETKRRIEELGNTRMSASLRQEMKDDLWNKYFQDAEAIWSDYTDDATTAWNDLRKQFSKGLNDLTPDEEAFLRQAADAGNSVEDIITGDAFEPGRPDLARAYKEILDYRKFQAGEWRGAAADTPNIFPGGEKVGREQIRRFFRVTVDPRSGQVMVEPKGVREVMNTMSVTVKNRAGRDVTRVRRRLGPIVDPAKDPQLWLETLKREWGIDLGADVTEDQLHQFVRGVFAQPAAGGGGARPRPKPRMSVPGAPPVRGGGAEAQWVEKAQSLYTTNRASFAQAGMNEAEVVDRLSRLLASGEDGVWSVGMLVNLPVSKARGEIISFHPFKDAPVRDNLPVGQADLDWWRRAEAALSYDGLGLDWSRAYANPANDAYRVPIVPKGAVPDALPVQQAARQAAENVPVPPGTRQPLPGALGEMVVEEPFIPTELPLPENVAARLDKIENMVTRQWGRTRPANLDAEKWKLLEGWAELARRRGAEARAIGGQVGTAARDFTLLNYSDRVNMDTYLGFIAPYQFWYGRTYANWAGRALAHPNVMAAYARYRNGMKKMHAALPEWWQQQLSTDDLGIPLDTPLMVNLEQQLSPLYGALGTDFRDPDKSRLTVAGLPVGQAFQAMQSIGPSPMIQLGWLAAAATASRDPEAARAMVEGYMGPWARLARVASAAYKETGAPGSGAIPPGGVNADPQMMFRDTITPGKGWNLTSLTDWEVQRIQQKMATMTANPPPGTDPQDWVAQIKDQQNLQRGPLWDQALNKWQAEQLVPQIIASVLGLGFKPRPQEQAILGQIVAEQYQGRQGAAEMTPEEWVEWEMAGREKHGYLWDMAKYGRGNAGDDSYIWEAMSRVGIGNYDLWTAAGVSQEALDQFMELKTLEAMDPELRGELLTGATDINGVLRPKSADEQRRQLEARNAYKSIEANLAAQFPAEAFDLETQFFDYRGKYGDDAADEWLANLAPSELDALRGMWDARSSARMAEPDMAVYYVDLERVRGQIVAGFYDDWNEKVPNLADVREAYKNAADDPAAQRSIRAKYPVWEDFRSAQDKFYSVELPAAVVAYMDSLPEIEQFQPRQDRNPTGKAQEDITSYLAGERMKLENPLTALGLTRSATSGSTGYSTYSVTRPTGPNDIETEARNEAEAARQLTEERSGYVGQYRDAYATTWISPLISTMGPDKAAEYIQAPVATGWGRMTNPPAFVEDAESFREGLMAWVSEHNDLSWVKALGWVKAMPARKVDQYMRQYPQLGDLQMVWDALQGYDQPSLAALHDVLGMTVSIKEDGGWSISSQTIKTDEAGGDFILTDYITQSAEAQWPGVVQLAEEYLALAVQNPEQAAMLWAQNPQIKQYFEYDKATRKQYADAKKGKLGSTPAGGASGFGASSGDGEKSGAGGGTRSSSGGGGRKASDTFSLTAYIREAAEQQWPGITDTYNAYLRVAMLDGDEAAAIFWAEHPELEQYMAFKAEVTARYNKYRGGAPAGQGGQFQPSDQADISTWAEYLGRYGQVVGPDHPQSPLNVWNRLAQAIPPDLLVQLMDYFDADPYGRNQLLSNPQLAFYLKGMEPWNLVRLENAYKAFAESSGRYRERQPMVEGYTPAGPRIVRYYKPRPAKAGLAN